ncbi:EA22-like protein; similarities with EA22 from lambda (modular protein involved in blocking host replication) [Escherichia coli]|uniref:ead/Ea22-like family protein n=1 Tax=Escherichia coli TaxID=562 RepID=UPI000DFAA4D5|nr:ead/Ea22-like family protein [Escherichia coli]STK33106.1 EA22-like protein; similarities with EA22 from lambda (modular protein involved in blocking host replication) [Escherichia coli]STQ54297.1 EA22-like protein; similarities with EA22 from lambda (modular protein involved in blocking host replication) [Escherichia coli]
MSKIDYQELREAAEQATQDEWVAYILPGHNGIYPARTSEGRHCGYFIDWPGVCQGRESISIRTYAVNCNDAWLNTEGDDISGSYVKYKDHQEVVAALEAKCAALAAENAGIKSAIPESRDIEDDNDNMDDVSLAEDFGFNHAIERMRRQIPETPTTDTFLAEVRAQGVDAAIEAAKNLVAQEYEYKDFKAAQSDCCMHPGSDLVGKVEMTEWLVDFAAQLRKGGNQ